MRIFSSLYPSTILIANVIIILSIGCNPNQNPNQYQGQDENKTGNIKFEKSPDDFDELRERLSNLDNTSALSVAIIRPDTTFIWDFGKATDSSMFRVGSLSKSFAGLSILKLVEEGKISLDAKVNSLAPELNIDNPFDKTHPVLIRHLIEASAGFVGFYRENRVQGPDIIAIKKVVLENHFPFKAVWQPGQFASYDNFAPVLSAYLVEKISLVPYRDFVRKNFFDPLDMNNTTFLVDERVKDRLIDYNDSTYLHIRQRPSGSLNSSTREFVHLLQMLLNNGSYANKQILSQESINQFETSTSNLASKILGLKLGHAVNNWTVHYNGINYNGHGGTISPGYVNFYAYSREYKTAFVIMANKSNGTSRNDAAEIVQMILPYIQPLVEKPTVQRISQAEENEYLGCYQQVTKKSVNQPAWEISLARDSIGNLVLIDNNFDNPPYQKILEPTSTEYVYVDRNPENNSATSGQALYALLTTEDGDRFLQKISLSHEGYKKIPCE